MPQPIDKIYSKYNFEFAVACESLMNHVAYWSDLRINADIPEDMKEDIARAVGQAKLLLSSKLPQFAELLCKYMFPPSDAATPRVLECDLAGWWAVADTQINQVIGTFTRLKCLEVNDWSELLKDPEVKEEESVQSKPKKKNSTTPKKPKTPLKGVSKFKEFIQNKKSTEASGEAFGDGLEIQSLERPATATSPPHDSQ